MVDGDFISKFVKVVERVKVVCYRFEGATPLAVALYLPENHLTESGSVNEACRKKRMCVMYLIALLTSIHWSIAVYSMLLWFVYQIRNLI